MRRIIAFAVTLCMVFAMLPAQVFAETAENQIVFLPIVSDETVEPSIGPSFFSSGKTPVYASTSSFSTKLPEITLLESISASVDGARIQAIATDGTVVGQTAGFSVYPTDTVVDSRELFFLDALTAGEYALQLIYGDIEDIYTAELNYTLTVVDAPVITGGSLSLSAGTAVSELNLNLYGYKGDPSIYSFSLLDGESEGTIACAAVHTGTYEYSDGEVRLTYALTPEAGLVQDNTYYLVIQVSNGSLYSAASAISSKAYNRDTSSAIAILEISEDANTVGGLSMTVGGIEASTSYTITAALDYAGDQALYSGTLEPVVSGGNGTFTFALTYNGLNLPLDVYENAYIYISIWDESGNSDTLSYRPENGGSIYQSVNLELTETGENKYAFVLTSRNVLLDLYEQTDALMFTLKHYDSGTKNYVQDSVAFSEIEKTTYNENGNIYFAFSGTLTASSALDASVYYYLFLDDDSLAGTRPSVISGENTGLELSSFQLAQWNYQEKSFFFNFGFLPLEATLRNSGATATAAIYDETAQKVVSEATVSGTQNAEAGGYDFLFLLPEAELDTAHTYTIQITSGDKMVSAADYSSSYASMRYDDTVETPSYFDVEEPVFSGDTTLTMSFYQNSQQNIDKSYVAEIASTIVNEAAETGLAYNNVEFTFQENYWYATLQLTRALTAGTYTYGDYNGFTVLPVGTVVLGNARSANGIYSITDCYNLPAEGTYTGVLYEATDSAYVKKADLSLVYANSIQLNVVGMPSNLTDGSYTIEVWLDGQYLGAVSCYVSNNAETAYGPYIKGYGVEENSDGYYSYEEILHPTASEKVFLTTYLDGYAYVRFSEDGSFADVSYQPIRTYHDQELTLSHGTGIKTIYIQFRTSAGTESEVYTWSCQKVEAMATPAILNADILVGEMSVTNVPDGTDFTLQLVSASQLNGVYARFVESDGSEDYDEFFLSYAGAYETGGFLFECRLNSGDWPFYSYHFNAVNFYLTDLTGNEEYDTKTLPISFGDVGLYLDAWGDDYTAYTNQTDFTVSGIATPGSTVTIELDNSTEYTGAADSGTGAFSIVLPGLTEDSYSLYVSDGTLSGSVQLVVDITEPVITSFKAALTDGGSAAVSWSCTESNLKTYLLYRDDALIQGSETTRYGEYTDTNYIAVNAAGATFTLVAVDEAGNRTQAEVTVGDTEAPTAPGIPTLTAHGTKSIAFEWTASTDNVAVYQYKVYRNNNLVATLPYTQLSYTDDELNEGTSYRYEIYASDRSSNQSNASPAAELSTAILTISDSTAWEQEYIKEEYTETGVSIYAYLDTSDEKYDLTGTVVKLQYKAADASDWSNLTLTAGQNYKYSGSWVIEDLAPGNYTVRFHVKDAEGTEKTSTESTVEVSQDTEPPTVILSAPTAGNTYGGKDIVVSGYSEDNVGVNRVVVSCAPVGSYSFSTVAEITNPDANDKDWDWQTAWDATDLESGNYQIKVVAYDIRNNSSNESVVTITIDNTPPADVKDFSVTGTSRYIHINWGYDALPTDNDFNSFRIYRGLSADKSSCELVHTQGLMLGYYEDGTTLIAGTKYYYYVTAVDDYGNESAGSELLSAVLTADNESPSIGDMRPAGGATLCNSAAISVTAADNYRLAKAVYEYRKVGNSDWILIGEKEAPTASNNTTFRYTWDISAIDTGEYEIRVSVYDDSINDIDENNSAYTANPAATETRTVTITKYTPPVAPVLSAVNGYKTVTLNWTYSGEIGLLSSFNIYRADTENGTYQLVKTLSASARSCALAVPLNTTYYYKIVACDRYDAAETSNIVNGSSAGTDTAAPVALISPETLLAAAGVPFTFSAVNSTDNDAIASYLWEFGDGESSTDAMTIHTYAQGGTYTVRLTVTDDAGNSNTTSASVTVIDIAAEDGEYTLVTFNVVDAAKENTPALEGATLQFSSNIEGASNTTAVTDSNGQAKVLLLRGQYTVSVSREGYMPRSANILVTYQESGIQSMTLGISSTSLVSGELTATEMTYDEIVAAGIDVNDPDNEQVWKFATVLEFTVGLETFEIPVVAGYRNKAGTFFNGGGGWFSFGGGSGGSGGGSGGRIGIFPMITEGFYLVIYGEAHWLKEMYNVELLVINNSNTDTIQNCTGTLVLPQGLSLAAMLHTSQTETINLGEIAKGGSDTATWYVRGDEAGDYYLTANVDGEFQSGDGVYTPFSTSFTTKEPVRVYAGNALHMTITAQDYAVRGEDYEVTFKLENVSDKSLYNLSFGITGIEQYKVLGVSYDGCYVESEPMLLDKEDFGDSMIKTVPELAPGGYIEIKVSTTIWFNSVAEVAEIGVDLLLESKAGLGGAILGELINVVYYLTSVDVVTLEGSTTSVPYSVNIEQKERDNILDVFIKTISKELFLKDLQQGSIGGMMISVVGKSVEMDGTMISGAKSLLELQQGETDYTFEISINDGTGSSTCIENDYIKITSGTEGEGIFDFLNGTGWKVNGTEIAFEAKMPGTSEIKLSVKNKYGELEREYTLNVTVEDTVLENKITAVDGEVDGSFRVNENALEVSLKEQYEQEYAQFEKNPFALNPSKLIFELDASGSDYNFALTADDLNTIMEESGTTVVTVDGADVDVSIGMDALDNVMGEGTELVIGTKLLSAEENAALGLEGTTYELTAKVDTVMVSDFGSVGDEVTVSIDYVLPADVAPEDLVLFCIKDDGSTELIDCNYDVQNQILSFQTGHFSYYNIQTTNLSAVKDEAKSILDTYKNADDYRDAQKTELANAIAAGKAAIDAATDSDAVASALAAAKATMDAIKTDAQLGAEELAAAKTAAKEALESYKNAADYRDAQKIELANAIAAGKVAIDAADDADAVAAALDAAKSTMDAIKTDAQLDAEEESYDPPTTPSVPSISTETVKNEDGSVTTIVTDKSTGTVTETTKFPDGSQVVTKTDRNGTVTVTETDEKGNEMTTVTTKAGDTTVTEKRTDGVVVKTVTTKAGETSATVTLSQKGKREQIRIPTQLGQEKGIITLAVTYGDGEKETLSGYYKDGFVHVGLDEDVELVILDGFAPITIPFEDVSANAYYCDAVGWAVAIGITSGTSATTFSPDASCTRAQIATFLWRAAGSPEPVGSEHPFTDVLADAYYAKAVQWAYEQEITGGTSATTFSPDATCTRDQMATFLWRNAGAPVTADGANPFADVSVNAYYAKAVQWAYEQEITGGTSATTFSPDDLCTRAQMVTFLYRNFVD